uniref:Nucleolar and coiled-body phosphoprotein 1 isoform X4 n=1 Tax=Cicer arietinum TaxID=3827 RepID=A0A1S2YPH3_CICAR|nr:nucleolar and coiled-body phosphoprotein 1 isoform X4 [Cicer arietinum]
MPANPSGIKGISTLFSFTPRQVLLNTPTMKHGADNGTIISEQKVKFLLHQSIALYLEHSGFSKTLKKFISEAKIEKDNTEGSSVDLEEMCRKFLETCNDAKSTINGQKEQGVHSKNEEEKPKEKKKKKSKLVSEAADNMEDNQLESLPMVPENKVKDDLSTDAKVENGAETEKQSKRKTKKKDAKVENGAETEKRSKHKMKKKDKSKSEGDAKEQIEDTDAIVSEKENFEASNEEATPEAKKDSKKRKRPISKENGEQDTEIKADEETKRRKIENLNGETDVHPGNGAAKSSVQSSQKKKHKESVEPKPANTPFQRVQVDKIDFVDERLQDNSYWAKDGAESGYGAKAQEILGQVRGRDFRHEKTKKKRGTYRGGFIDLQSHSVKFNVSDEE